MRVPFKKFWEISAKSNKNALLKKIYMTKSVMKKNYKEKNHQELK